MMKQRRLSIPMYAWICVFALALIGIVFGSFFDLAISDAIVNQELFLGRFVETLGESLAYAMIPIGGTTIFLGLYKRKNIWLKILGYFFLLLSLVISIKVLGDSFRAEKHPYGITFDNLTSFLISGCLMIVTSVMTYFFLDHKDERKLLIIGAVILIAMILQFVVMTVLKKLASRPRYRYLIDLSLNTDGEVFRSWWQFKPFTAIDDTHKSWPSGHTATAAECLLLASLAPVLRFRFKHDEDVLFWVGFGYTVLIAFSRVLYGAHFLSDVSFGLLFSSLLSFATVMVTHHFFEKKGETPDEVETH